MEEVMRKLRELAAEKEEKCDEECLDCILSQLFVKTDHLKIDICDFLKTQMLYKR